MVRWHNGAHRRLDQVTRMHIGSGADDLFAGGGEAGALMRSLDWSKTPLGAVSSWPQSLRTAVDILLNSLYPMFIFWGPHLVKIYNDAYRPMTGTKHPWAFGRPGPEVWPEIWDTIGPMVERVFDRGEATWSDDLMLFLLRHGYLEESYFTFSYSPIRDESGRVAGMFCAVTETTGRVIGERRLRMLRDLAVAPEEARTVEEACRMSIGVLKDNPKEIPFSLLYLSDGNKGPVRLAASSVQNAGRGWPVMRAIRSGRAEVIEDLSRFRGLPHELWPEPPRSAMVLPLAGRAQQHAVGAIVLGVSSRRPFDAGYRDLFGLVASQISASMANARAKEDERRRAESLAELDRAKTTFFSNISHEFRTPLTLILAPIEEGLADSKNRLPSAHRRRLELARRNGLRLQKLVNTLLDFSRIEAGRARAAFVPLDLSALTIDLASTFRSLVEGAGLKFAIDCPQLPEPVYADPSMWEKIVLNLLSNAFKFTFEGSIRVVLAWKAGRAELKVEDTGTGILAKDLPRIFERFHRVEAPRGRSQEGAGIGLALVQELVRLHGGQIEVESVVGKGTAFTVTIPGGTAHLPGGKADVIPALASTTINAESFLAEACQWNGSVSERSGALIPPALASQTRARILVADDNADMRDYIHHILSNQWTVDLVPDGPSALKAALEQAPDLVISDVMMPGLDGFQLLRALRTDPRTRPTPVILLSARAGNEAVVEGLDAGADDYLVKPFTAAELVARVRADLEMARLRKEALDARDRMLASVSHDLGNPLSVVTMASRVLLRSLPAGENEQHDLVERIQRAAAHMGDLIRDLLDLSRFEAGSLSSARSEQSAESLIRNAVDALDPLAQAKSLRVRVDVPQQPLSVRCDPEQTFRVFSNLLGNAIKFTPDGGSITVAARSVGRDVRFEVRDTGPGIAESDVPRLFDRYWQVAREAKHGTGLGLSIAKSFVENQGGRIWVETAPGKGSSFFFTLPLMEL
jgi:signal transduction histidine kinase/PAS domain-containing protein